MLEGASNGGRDLEFVVKVQLFELVEKAVQTPQPKARTFVPELFSPHHWQVSCRSPAPRIGVLQDFDKELNGRISAQLASTFSFCTSNSAGVRAPASRNAASSFNWLIFSS